MSTIGTPGVTTFEYGSSGDPSQALPVLRAAERRLDRLVGRAMLAIMDLGSDDPSTRGHLKEIQRIASGLHSQITGVTCQVEDMVETMREGEVSP